MTDRLVILTTSLERLTKVLLVLTIVATYPVLKDFAIFLKNLAQPAKVLDEKKQLSNAPTIDAKNG